MKHARADYNRIQDPAHLIPEDEPVFIIRAKDICAPHAVEAWAALAAMAGAPADIVTAARSHANDMRNWQKNHGAKIPDMPEDGAREVGK